MDDASRFGLVKPMMNPDESEVPVKRFLLFPLILLVMVSFAQAETLHGVGQTVRLYDGVLTFPAPAWVNSAEDLGKVKTNQQQTDTTFTLEQIPKDQEFDSWTRLSGVYGYKLPEYDMDRFFGESLRFMINGCKVKPKAKILQNKEGNRIVIFLCDELQDQWVVNGYNSEKAVVFMAQTKQSFVKVYQAFRGKNGTLDQESEAEFSEAIKRNGMMRFVPVE